MISRAQQILLKRAQRQAGLNDEEYRDAIGTVTALPGCRSSKDARLTDEHLDALLSYFEAIFWRKVDTEEGHLQAPCNGTDDIFQQRDFWSNRNRKGNTSRDRYHEAKIGSEVTQLESQMNDLGYGSHYLQAIQDRIQPFILVNYAAALRRTLSAKRKSLANRL